MPRRHIRVTGTPAAPLRAALTALRAELDIPEHSTDFPPEVLAEAEESARNAPQDATNAPRNATEDLRWPAAQNPARLPHTDATAIPFLTIDPPTSTDLDQAMHLSRQGTGYRVRYAIADVAAFVRPGGAVDAEAHRRVTTLYFPDTRVPLHPPVLSEGAASLLPDQVRPAALWTIDLDAEGRTLAVDVRRALVRSRVRYDYETAQRLIDAGTAEEPLALLAEIGRLRERQEAERGGISLGVPEQEIVPRDHTYELAYRAPLPAEGWNAQISLLTGMAAADLMLASGTGVLRTLPAAPDGAVGRLRRTAEALRVDWPHHVSYAALIRSLDPREPRHAAFLQECTTLLRGAGYTVFRDGELPDITTHAAVAAPYTHCTAPLRRLADRYANELCLAAVAGEAPPDWVRAALDVLPARMADGGRRANAAERACVDIVEAALLKDRVGEVFEAVLVDIDEDRPTTGTIQVTSPAVIGRIEGVDEAMLGRRLRARLTQADPQTRRVRFAPA